MAVPDAVIYATIPICSLVGILFAIFLWKRVSAIQLTAGSQTIRSANGREYLLEEEQRGEEEVRQRRARSEGIRPCLHLQRNTGLICLQPSARRRICGIVSWGADWAQSLTP